MARLTKLASHDETLPTGDELVAAREVIKTSPSSASHLALLGDKYLLFNAPRSAFLMFGISRRSWVALGDPIGESADRAELVWQFRERSFKHGGKPVFYEVSADNLPLYVDLGLSLHKLGEEARVSLEEFTLQGKTYKRLRQVVNKMQRDAFEFEVLELDEVERQMPRLESHPLAPVWHRVGTALFQHGEHFYNFQGLRSYKEKFKPHWEPRYLASPGGLALPVVLGEVSALISGGVTGVFRK